MAQSVPYSERVGESLSGRSPSSMRVKFFREPDLRIYDSENRAQETYFNPIIPPALPLTDQEIEEQERQVQRLIQEKERWHMQGMLVYTWNNHEKAFVGIMVSKFRENAWFLIYVQRLVCILLDFDHISKTIMQYGVLLKEGVYTF